MRRWIFMAVVFALTSTFGYAATYKSHDLDGKDFDCTAHSSATGADYDAAVEFSETRRLSPPPTVTTSPDEVD